MEKVKSREKTEMFYPNGAMAEEKQKINEAVFQMYMNDIFVGDGSGDLKLDEPIKRSEVIKLVIKHSLSWMKIYRRS